MEEMLFPSSRSFEKGKKMRLSYPEAAPVKKFGELLRETREGSETEYVNNWEIAEKDQPLIPPTPDNPKY